MRDGHGNVSSKQAKVDKTGNKKGTAVMQSLQNLAEWTGLEPATPGVTGRYSNQLNYHSWQETLYLLL
jgi:hypothetical protein